MRRTLLGFALLAIASVLPGCGEDVKASAAHNEADVVFAQQMVPHHEQALEMAALVPERTGSEAVRELATRTERARAPESTSSKPG